MIRLSKSQIEFLESHRVGHLATVSPIRMPHVVPICYAFNGENIILPIQCQTRKMKNLAKNNKVSLVIDDYSEDWSKLRGLLVQGEAKIIERGSEFKVGRDIIYRRYPQFEKLFPIQEGKYWIVKIKLRRAITIP